MEPLKYCIRVLKLWAKQRGVYSRVLGFLSGTSIAIMAARVGQMHPEALPSQLVCAILKSQLFARLQILALCM
jgi:poly(A) polymerase